MGRGVTWEGNGGSFKSGVDSIRKTKGNACIFEFLIFLTDFVVCVGVGMG